MLTDKTAKDLFGHNITSCGLRSLNMMCLLQWTYQIAVMAEPCVFFFSGTWCPCGLNGICGKAEFSCVKKMVQNKHGDASLLLTVEEYSAPTPLLALEETWGEWNLANAGDRHSRKKKKISSQNWLYSFVPTSPARNRLLTQILRSKFVAHPHEHHKGSWNMKNFC